MDNEKQSEGILYLCVSCNSKITAEEMELTPEVKCPICGSRVLKKARPPVVRRVKVR